MNNPQQNNNFYFDDNGLLVFTEEFLKKQGSCCGNGCKHCPYDYINVPEHLRQKFIDVRNANKES